MNSKAESKGKSSKGMAKNEAESKGESSKAMVKNKTESKGESFKGMAKNKAESKGESTKSPIVNDLIGCFGECEVKTEKQYVMMFVIVGRVLGMNVRYVQSLRPLSWKPLKEDLLQPLKEDEIDAENDGLLPKKQQGGGKCCKKVQTKGKNLSSKQIETLISDHVDSEKISLLKSNKRREEEEEVDSTSSSEPPSKK